MVVSLGPASHDVGALVGATLEDAAQALAQLYITASDDVGRFFTDAPADTVIGVWITPPGGGDELDCTHGCTAVEGSTARFAVSVGPVPDVAARTLADATAVLADAELHATPTEEYSETVDEGIVIRIADREDGGSFQPGDTVTLVVSKGPPLFEVPSVVGKTRDEAKEILADAGFQVTYFGPWDLFPDETTRVSSQTPGAGAMRVKGTEITLVIATR